MIKSILLIVDPQNDFITGTLAVEEAKEKMMQLSAYIDNLNCKYDSICITMDTHPDDHCSFKTNGGIWPSHCVTYTAGWNLPKYLDHALCTFSNLSGKLYSYYHKGTHSNKEEYSIFDNNEDGVKLANWIQELSKENEVYVDICGIAGDYCVLETLKGLRKIMGDNYIRVRTEFTASIDGGEKLLRYLDENNINYTT